MQINLTEEQIAELARCYYDPIYFIENYTWIEVKEQSKIIPTVLYPYQRTILNWLINRKSGLVLKSRRVGGSTVVGLYLTWLINFRRGIKALLISRKEEMAIDLLSKVRFSFFNVRKHTSNDFSLAEDATWMLNTVAINNQQLFATGWLDDAGNVTGMSEVASLTTTSESGRGASATFVFIDEMAFIQDQDETSRAATLTTTRGGHWLAISTPNGVGNVFHSLCMRAERGENEFYKYLRVHWSEAGMNEEMIRAATEGISEASRLQEMELEFLSSGDPVFNHVHLAACYKPIEDYPEVGEELLRYKNLVNKRTGEHIYYSGVDTAVGKLTKKDSKRDYHSFTSLTKSGIQAFAYHDKKMSLIEWAGNVEQMAGQSYIREGKVSQLHRDYPGLLYVEVNGPGQTVIVNHRPPQDGFSNIVAKATTHKSKDQLIRQLILGVESHSIIITDKFTYQCMVVFQRGSIPGTYSAPSGEYYDDPVISLALAWDSLLQSGLIEFSWGSGTDNLVRAEKTTDEVNDADIAMMGYGPAIMQEASKSERLSNLFNENEVLLVDSDLDLGRIQQPSFVGDN